MKNHIGLLWLVLTTKNHQQSAFPQCRLFLTYEKEFLVTEHHKQRREMRKDIEQRCNNSAYWIQILAPVVVSGVVFKFLFTAGLNSGNIPWMFKFLFSYSGTNDDLNSWINLLIFCIMLFIILVKLIMLNPFGKINRLITIFDSKEDELEARAELGDEYIDALLNRHRQKSNR